MARMGDKIVVTRRRNARRARADRLPELLHHPDRVLRGILVRADENVRIPVQRREGRFRPGLLGARHRVAADEMDAVGSQAERRLHDAGFAAAEVAHDRTGAEAGGVGHEIVLDLRQRQGEKREVGLAERLLQRVAAFVEHVAVDRPAADGLPAGPADAAINSPAQRHAERSAEQPESDDRNDSISGLIHDNSFR